MIASNTTTVLYLPTMLSLKLFVSVIFLYNTTVLGVYFFENNLNWYSTQKSEIDRQLSNGEENVLKNYISESKSPTEELPPKCLEGQTLFSAHDLKEAIDYFTDELQIYKSINDSYYDTAIDVRNQNIQEIKIFQSWFGDRPQHLKHILEELARSRQAIEPLVAEISSALQEYPYLQMKFKEKSDRATEILENLNTQKQICKLTCNRPWLESAQMQLERVSLQTTIEQNQGQKYGYCDSMMNLFGQIKTKLENYVNISKDEINYKIIVDHDSYKNKIVELKNNLKDIALKDFGRIMYDILNLQDEYYHFYHKVRNVNPKRIHLEINQNLAQVDPLLMKLEVDTRQFGMYCRNCNDKHHNQLHLHLRSSDLSDNVKDESSNILDQLLATKIAKINKEVEADYNLIFEELNSIFLDDKVTPNHMYNLKPLQDEIESMTEDERYYFESLKNEVSKTSMQKTFNLLDDSKQLLYEISHELKYIVEYIGYDEM
ncbi:uncharacterized protein LOC113521442 [Galleria mellonella]|uniref:Uncharacterized protein LOC113521442 n=1 Tax=Galleria mellonella TaxID=7137 RepID=A0A6J3C9P0_GALME|nr:uncharacterized protein LOC113521442 [Galleria mellonella]